MGRYEVVLHFPPGFDGGTITLTLNDDRYTATASPDARLHTFESIDLAQGPMRLLATLDNGRVTTGPWQVEIRRVNLP